MIEEDEDRLETMFPLPWWFVLFAMVLFGYGCASPSPRSEVCTMQLLGQTEARVPVVAMHCISPEAFAESQK